MHVGSRRGGRGAASGGGLRRAARRVVSWVLRLVVVGAVALALPWLTGRSPLAAVVTALGVVLLGVAVLRVLRARHPLVALGWLGAYLILGLMLGALVVRVGDGLPATAEAARSITDTPGDCRGCGAGDPLALEVSIEDGTTTLTLSVDGCPSLDLPGTPRLRRLQHGRVWTLGQA